MVHFQVLKFLAHYETTDDDIAYLRTLMPHADVRFWHYLRHELDMSQLKVGVCHDQRIRYSQLYRTPRNAAFPGVCHD